MAATRAQRCGATGPVAGTRVSPGPPPGVGGAVSSSGQGPRAQTLPASRGDGARRRHAKLDTADCVRRFLGEQTFRPVLLYQIEAFLAVSAIAGWIAGEQAVRRFSGRMRMNKGTGLLTPNNPANPIICPFIRWPTSILATVKLPITNGSAGWGAALIDDDLPLLQLSIRVDAPGKPGNSMDGRPLLE